MSQKPLSASPISIRRSTALPAITDNPDVVLAPGGTTIVSPSSPLRRSSTAEPAAQSVLSEPTPVPGQREGGLADSASGKATATSAVSAEPEPLFDQVDDPSEPLRDPDSSPEPEPKSKIVPKSLKRGPGSGIEASATPATKRQLVTAPRGDQRNKRSEQDPAPVATESAKGKPTTAEPIRGASEVGDVVRTVARRRATTSARFDARTASFRDNEATAQVDGNNPNGILWVAIVGLVVSLLLAAGYLALSVTAFGEPAEAPVETAVPTTTPSATPNDDIGAPSGTASPRSDSTHGR